MLFEDKTQKNIMMDMISSVDGDISTNEGSLIDHSFRGAAAEFERAYMEMGMIDQNGYAATADREHLILRAREGGIVPLKATNAVWAAEFNIDVPVGSRFSARQSSYVCTEKIGAREYRLTCEQPGMEGNIKNGNLNPIEYIEGWENGELTELLIPARGEETTEAFRERYLSSMKETRAFGGNRAQYRKAMHGIEGVGACKIYRVTQKERRIKIYFLDSLYQIPSSALVGQVQEIIDPIGKQGEGEGEAAIFHVVDIYPCQSESVNIEADITLNAGYVWEDILLGVQKEIDGYFQELAKSWENETHIIVRILKINAAIADVTGVIDVQGTMLNGKESNLLLEPNAIPVRGEILCRQ